MVGGKKDKTWCLVNIEKLIKEAISKSGGEKSYEAR